MRGRVGLKHRVLSRAFFLFVCAGWFFHLASTATPQTHDYLTEEEIEQLREAQEPHLRMNVLTGILNKRFEKVRLAGTHRASAKEETPEQDSESKISNQKSADPKPRVSRSKAVEKQEAPETLEEILNDYLSCIDEVSTNVENSDSLPLDPKEFLKSLNKVDSFLQKQYQWFKSFETKGLKKSERETSEEIIQAQRELAEDLGKTMDHLMEEIKRVKDGKKAAEKKE